MREKKIETLFNEAIIVGDLLKKNLQQFEKSHHSVNKVYSNIEKLAQTIEQISLYSQDMKQEEAQRFSREIREQVDRYYIALQEINLDTSAIEKLIERYNTTVIEQIDRIEESTRSISETLKENGEVIIAAAYKLKRGRGSMLSNFILFTTGVAIGALFLAAYPIAAASKTFYSELKARDTQIQQLEEHYETNSKMVAFLREHDITINTGTTDDGWTKRSFRFSPMILLNEKRVKRVDEISGYTRILFSKNKNKE